MPTKPSNLAEKDSFGAILACPKCKSSLESGRDRLWCVGPGCCASYPIFGEKPILICEERSLFKSEGFRDQVDKRKVAGWKARLGGLIPSLNLNVNTRHNCRMFADLVCSEDAAPVILVIGSGSIGNGMEEILANPRITVVNLDVNFGENVHIVADGHDLPFLQESVDGVVLQAVLEHVIDPVRVVAEVWRVLKRRGVVFADTPFIQQVHERQYDFTRFTCLGQRRLFRYFDLIAMGASCGPGMALAWSYDRFLRSFFRSRKAHKLASLVSHFTVFWLKYLDYYLVTTPAGIDAASQCYFLGRKRPEPVDDRDLIACFPGVLDP